MYKIESIFFNHAVYIHIKVYILYVDRFKEYEIMWLTENSSLNAVYFKHKRSIQTFNSNLMHTVFIN